MGRLYNTRHERFAVALARGDDAHAAYAGAGYKPDRGHASRLAANGSIRDRVAEIMEKAAKEAELTLERVLRELAKVGYSDIRGRWSTGKNRDPSPPKQQARRVSTEEL